jgi:hypothetical protein
MATATSLPATFVANSVLTAAEQNALRGAFRVLQVVTATTSTVQTSSSTTYVDATSLTLSITPQAATNKVLIQFMTMGSKDAANSNNNLGIKLLRGSTVIAAWESGLFTGVAQLLIVPVCYNFLDAPSTTSATTYKIQFANANNNGASVSIQNSSHPAMLMAQEISA